MDERGHSYDDVTRCGGRCCTPWMQVSFLTPVELFTPWYGYILARHILEHRKHNLGQEGQPLVLYEIGGGNGTLARDILVGQNQSSCSTDSIECLCSRI